ncbi:MAG: C10 family peptidase [Capnocytophaga sp.]|nr:C10 family peptidase [Capnocytophaga sp.]
MRKWIVSFGMMGILISCQREDVSTSFTEETSISALASPKAIETNTSLLAMTALTGQTHISVEEAQKTALATAMQMREVEGIVTKSPLEIASVEVVKDNTRKPYVATKAGTTEQADVYIVNFANEQGYVITSADRRLPSVLAYNSYGHLGDTPDNPGQAILFSYMQEFIQNERESFEANKEKLIQQAEEEIFKQLSKEKQAELIKKGFFDEKGKRVKTKGKKIETEPIPFCLENYIFSSVEDEIEYYNSITGTSYGDWKVKSIIPPLLKTLWSQSGSYNNKVPMYCDNIKDEAPVGCVATAVGQILAFHKKPTIFKGRAMHWEDMIKTDRGDMFSSIYSYNIQTNTTAKEDIQHLLAHLGDNDLLAMSYDCKGSGSNKALETLHSLGYTNANKIDFNHGNDAINEIKKGYPVYIEGCALEKTYSSSSSWWIFKDVKTKKYYEECHAWVLDGYVLKTQPMTIHIVCGKIEPIYYKSENPVQLIHNNFGWGGSTNGENKAGTGWYHIGVFNSNKNQESSNLYKSGIKGDYKFLNKIITNIK